MADVAVYRGADANVAIGMALVVDEIVAVGVTRISGVAKPVDEHRTVAVEDRKAEELR